MSEQLQTTTQLLNPMSGEVLTLASPDKDLGTLLRDLRDFKGIIQENIRQVEQELHRRWDHEAKWTHRYEGGMVLTGTSPAPVESWDGAELREALVDLHDRGHLAIEAVDAAVETVVTYKVRKAGVNQLRKVPAAREVVDRLCRTEEKARRVSVSRIG